MEDRKGLPKLFQKNYSLGVGVEVGSFRGDFSKEILEKWRGELKMVDSYEDSVPGLDMVGAIEEATKKLEGKAFTIIKDTSVNAATLFGNETLDFVYIDADHTYGAVKDDLEAWVPKVRPGGVVSGHDYFDGLYLGIHFGVKLAVDEYARDNKKIVEATKKDEAYEGFQFRSWWFIK